MKLTEEDRGGHTILRIEGSLKLGETTRALQERFEKIATEKLGAVVLDLAGLEHLDSTAVGVLVGGMKRFEAQTRRFYIASPRERVASVFHITHLDTVFRVFPTVEGAFASLAQAQEDETGEH